MNRLFTAPSLAGPDKPAHKTSSFSRQNGYYLQNATPLRPERRTRPINLHGLHGNVVAIKIGPSVRKLASTQRRHVPNNDFNRSKQGKNYIKDTVVTYLYIKNIHKSLVQQVQTSLKAKEGLVLSLGRGTRRNQDSDKILYVSSMRVSNPCNVNNP